MNNFVEIFSGKHENVTLMMNASERRKLARMRDFLCAEEEIYEKLDHYDIANMTDAELDGLLELSFDAGQIALPDDVEALLDDLRRDVGEEGTKTPSEGGHISFFGHCKRYSAAAAVFSAFSALSVTAYLATSSKLHISEISVISPWLEESSPGTDDMLDTAAVSLSETRLSLPRSFDTLDSAGGLPFGNLSIGVHTSDLVTASVMPDGAASIASMTGFLPAPQGALATVGYNQDGGLRPSTVSASIGEHFQAGTGGWVLSQRSGIATERFADQVISALEREFGEDIAARAIIEGNNRSVVVPLDGQELYIFNLTLAEGESVYTTAQEAEIHPNVFRLINRALEEGAQVDTTTMALNDRVVGIASRQGDDYELAELYYDRARSSDVLVYSNCVNPEQSVSALLPLRFDSQACVASAAITSTAASTDLQ